MRAVNQVVLRVGAAYDATYTLPITCNHVRLTGTSGLLVAWLVWFDPPYPCLRGGDCNFSRRRENYSGFASILAETRSRWGYAVL